MYVLRQRNITNGPVTGVHVCIVEVVIMVSRAPSVIVSHPQTHVPPPESQKSIMLSEEKEQVHIYRRIPGSMDVDGALRTTTMRRVRNTTTKATPHRRHEVHNDIR